MSFLWMQELLVPPSVVTASTSAFASAASTQAIAVVTALPKSPQVWSLVALVAYDDDVEASIAAPQTADAKHTVQPQHLRPMLCVLAVKSDTVAADTDTGTNPKPSAYRWRLPGCRVGPDETAAEAACVRALHEQVRYGVRTPLAELPVTTSSNPKHSRPDISTLCHFITCVVVPHAAATPAATKVVIWLACMNKQNVPWLFHQAPAARNDRERPAHDHVWLDLHAAAAHTSPDDWDVYDDGRVIVDWPVCLSAIVVAFAKFVKRRGRSQ